MKGKCVAAKHKRWQKELQEVRVRRHWLGIRCGVDRDRTHVSAASSEEEAAVLHGDGVRSLYPTSQYQVCACRSLRACMTEHRLSLSGRRSLYQRMQIFTGDTCVCVRNPTIKSYQPQIFTYILLSFLLPSLALSSPRLQLGPLCPLRADRGVLYPILYI